MKVMLLAAGLGTRLRPLTDSYAKPAVPFLNIPLLYYPFSLLEGLGIDELIVNTHHKPWQVEQLATSIAAFTGRVQISHEESGPLGSGGGVWAAKRWLEGEEDFCVANGDEVIFPSQLDIPTRLMMQHRKTGALATLMVMRHADVGTRFGGIWIDETSGRVFGFGKTRPSGAHQNAVARHYVGVIALSKRVFQYLPNGESNLLYDALTTGIAAGETVTVFEDRCSWFETGNLHDFHEASKTIFSTLQQPNEAPLLKKMRDRFRAGELKAFGDRALCGVGTQIGPKFVVRGFAIIGHRTVIGRDCILKDSVLLPETEISDGSRIENEVRF